MTRRTSSSFLAFPCTLLLAPSFGAEEATLQAFSVYQSEGEISRTGPEQASFAGTASGLFFVQTSEGPGRASLIMCPSSLEIDLQTGAQSGKGKCTIETPEGDSVFADWTCKGYHLVGCRGDFRFTGGTGPYEAASGGGKMVVRSDVHELAIESSGTVSRTSQGVIWWEALQVKLPGS